MTKIHQKVQNECQRLGFGGGLVCHDEPFRGIFAPRRPIQSEESQNRNGTVRKRITRFQNRGQEYLVKKKIGIFNIGGVYVN